MSNRVDLLTAALAEIARLREERRWVPVRERLPEVGVEVFVGCFNKRGTPLFHAVAKWQRAPSGLCVWEDEDCVIHHPTHWQPLPAPPSEGEVE